MVTAKMHWHHCTDLSSLQDLCYTLKFNLFTIKSNYFLVDVLEDSMWSLNDVRLLIFLQSSGAMRRFSFLSLQKGILTGTGSWEKCGGIN